MTIEVKCPNRSCDQLLALGPEMAGKKGKCPKCGKTFQIPQSLGQRPAHAAQQPARQKPAAVPQRDQKQSDVMPADELSAYLADEDDLFADEPSPAQRRRRKPAPTAEVIEDYEADVAPGAPLYGQPHRTRRRRRDDDAADAADPYEADDEDDVPRRGMKGSGGLSKTRRWMLGSVGFLILAIAMCVLAGSHGFLILSEAFAQLSLAADKHSLIKASIAFVRISQVAWLLAVIAVITGYSFCLFIPNKRATLGLTIAALSVCVLNLIMGIVFRFVPGVRGELHLTEFSGRSLHAGWGGGSPPAGDEVLSMFLELGIVAELMLVSLLLAEIARAQKDRHHKADCMRVVWFLTGMAGAMFVMYMLMFFIDVGSEKWLQYIVRIFNWACNGLLALSFVFLILNLFFTRKSTS